MTLEPHLQRGQKGHPFLTSIFKMYKSFQKASILPFKRANWYLHGHWGSAHNTWSSPLCDCNEHSPLIVVNKNHRPCQDVYLTWTWWLTAEHCARLAVRGSADPWADSGYTAPAHRSREKPTGTVLTHLPWPTWSFCMLWSIFKWWWQH